MSTFNCTFTEFKKAGKELLDGIANSTPAQVANGVKALNLMYFGIDFGNGPFAENDRFQAPIALRLILREVKERCPGYLAEYPI